MAVVDELVTVLSLQVDPQSAQSASRFQGFIDSTRKLALGLGTALIAAEAAISAYTVSLAESLDKQGKFSQSTGVSIESLQSLGYAVERFGGSTQDLQSDLQSLTDSMASPIPGEFNENLALLGIRVHDASGKLKTADKILFDISDRMQGLSHQQATQLGAKLGLSQGTIRLLKSGRKSIAQLIQEAKELGLVLSKEDAKKAAAFNDAMLNLKRTSQSIANTLSLHLMPVITKIIQQFTQWLKINRKWINLKLKQVIDGINQGFSLFYQVMMKCIHVVTDFLPELSKFNDDLDGTRVIALATAIALGILAVSALIAISPFILLGAILAGVFIILEDIWTYFQGGDSLLGDFVDSFTNGLLKLTKALKTFGQLIKEVIIADIQKLLNEIKKPFDYLLEQIEVFSLVFFHDFYKLKGWLSKNDKTKKTPKDLSAIYDPVLEHNRKYLINPSIVQQSNQQNTHNNTAHITVMGAGDPSAVGQEVARYSGFSSALQNTAPGNLPIVQ